MIQIEKLRAISMQATAARQFFNSHTPEASEFHDRMCLDKIEFLLSVIKELMSSETSGGTDES